MGGIKIQGQENLTKAPSEHYKAMFAFRSTMFKARIGDLLDGNLIQSSDRSVEISPLEVRADYAAIVVIEHAPMIEQWLLVHLWPRPIFDLAADPQADNAGVPVFLDDLRNAEDQWRIFNCTMAVVLQSKENVLSGTYRSY